MKILDSDFIIGVLQGDRDALEKLKAMADSGEDLATTVVNAQEVLYLPFMRDEVGEVEACVKMLESMRVLSYEYPSPIFVVKISVGLKKRGEGIGDLDEMIAGICMRHGATIVTRNVKHFSRVKGLKVESW